VAYTEMERYIWLLPLVQVPFQERSALAGTTLDDSFIQITGHLILCMVKAGLGQDTQRDFL
jgi:hypothetical protein